MKGAYPMSKLKIFLLMMALTTTSVFAYNFDKTLPLPGKTITDSKLQAEAMMPIYYYSLRVAEPGCQDFKIANTEVSKAKANNTWNEIWTVKACKTTAKIPIIFNQDADGTYYSIDYMNVKVAK